MNLPTNSRVVVANERTSNNVRSGGSMNRVGGGQ